MKNNRLSHISKVISNSMLLLSLWLILILPLSLFSVVKFEEQNVLSVSDVRSENEYNNKSIRTITPTMPEDDNYMKTRRLQYENPTSDVDEVLDVETIDATTAPDDTLEITE